MGQIISGQVFYSRKTKPGDYEHEQADVRLDFNIDDGEDASPMLANAGKMAKDHAHRILHAKPNTDALPPQLASAPAPAAGTTGKDKLVAEAAAATGAPKTGTAEAAPKPKATKPPKAEPKVEPPKAEPEATSTDDDLADLLGAAPEEITDADLVGKVTTTNGRIKNPGAIKALIGKYVAFPKGVKDIPPALRAGFVAELEKLQPAA